MITSAQNPRLRYVRRLARRAFRRREGCCVLEGERLIADALAAGGRPRLALLRPERAEGRLASALADAGAAVLNVAPELFDDLADTVHSQGILAVFELPPRPLPPAPRLLLVLDAWRDPGNLGTALRSAAAAGADGVVAAPGSVDTSNPKVLRAAMGAHFRLPVVNLDWAAIAELCAATEKPIEARLADAAGAEDYRRLSWDEPVAILVGGEAGGASPEARALARRTVRVPMPGGLESLNAASAATLLLFEAIRGRG